MRRNKPCGSFSPKWHSTRTQRSRARSFRALHTRPSSRRPNRASSIFWSWALTGERGFLTRFSVASRKRSCATLRAPCSPSEPPPRISRLFQSEPSVHDYGAFPRRKDLHRIQVELRNFGNDLDERRNPADDVGESVLVAGRRAAESVEELLRLDALDHFARIDIRHVR